MDWLRRIRRTAAPVSPAGAAVAAEPAPEAGDRAAPGIAALLEGVSQDRSHAVLDLGPAADSSLRVYSRFASRIRFADLLGEGRWPRAQPLPDLLLSTIPPQPDRPYDLIFAWDVLDRLFPEDHPRLVKRLAELSAPDARLHVVVRTSDDATRRPLRFMLLDLDRMRYEPTGTSRLARARLLPADVAHLLEPFRVVRAFTLKGGLREYVAIRGGAEAAKSG